MADTEGLAPEDLALINEIRQGIHALGFEPLDDEALAAKAAGTRDAVEDAASEGIHTTPRLTALHAMLIEERAPDEVWDWAVKRFMDAVAAEATRQ